MEAVRIATHPRRFTFYPGLLYSLPFWYQKDSQTIHMKKIKNRGIQLIGTMQRHNRFTKFVPNSVYVCDDVKWNQKTSKHNKNRQENRINPFSGTDLFAFINDPSPWFMSFYCVRSWCSQSDRDNGHYCWKMCKCVITMTNVCVEFVLLFWYSTANKENWFESWKKWQKSGRFRIRRKIVKMEIFINYRKERKSKRNLMKKKIDHRDSTVNVSHFEFCN